MVTRSFLSRAMQLESSLDNNIPNFDILKLRGSRYCHRNATYLTGILNLLLMARSWNSFCNERTLAILFYPMSGASFKTSRLE